LSIKNEFQVHDYLSQLNKSQHEAVVNSHGASLIIAGAGSGKTRVLTYRIAHLLEKGVKPSQILALTFTNKAAREMKLRIATIVGDDVAKYLWMGTFHSIFARILRMEAKKIHYPSSFTIYDTTDSKSLIKSILKEMKLPDKVYKPGDILGRISSAKNDLITPNAYARDVNRMTADKAAQKPMVYEIYTRYMRHCFKSGVMDFDDLLLNTNILFRDNPETLLNYQNRFQYILVDEYQDTNLSQYRIIKKLAEKHHNICVVGDDAQSIYSFRGAKIENILNFRNDYPGYQLFKLEQNYRSTQTIVEAANSIIANNKGQIHKRVFSEKPVGSPIKVLKAYSDVEEGYLIANEVKEQILKQNCSYKDFAILYRTNAQSRIFEEAFLKRNFPYRIYGGQSFYQRKEIKDLLAYFRVVINPNDQESIKRIVNYPARGIGNTTMEKLEAQAIAEDKSIWGVLTTSPLATLNSGTQKKLSGFIQLMLRFMMKVTELNAYDLAVEVVTESGILKELHQDKSVESQGRIENIEELINAIKEFTSNKIEAGESPSLVHFLEEVSLLTDQDTNNDQDDNRITMMTIHSAKGLEFKNVYIVGVEEGLFPSPMSSDTEKQIEEERRLFYVAITRAEDTATISFAKSRYKYGEIKFSSPSRFIGEIDQKFLDISGIDLSSDSSTLAGIPTNRQSFNSPKFQRRESASQPKFNISNQSTSPVNFNFNQIGSKLIPGTRVLHDRFGQGTIISMIGNDNDKKAIIAFDNTGEKQLLLKFAKLKILN